MPFVRSWLASCGDGRFLKKSIVPHCYRQHLPSVMKAHASHDILLCALLPFVPAVQ
jgi:hypothetical protein